MGMNPVQEDQLDPAHRDLEMKEKRLNGGSFRHTPDPVGRLVRFTGKVARQRSVQIQFDVHARKFL